MRILHLNTYQEGGAAYCAVRINKALVAEGVDSKMLFAFGNEMPKGVEGAIAEKDWCIGDYHWLLAALVHRIGRLSPRMNRYKYIDMLRKANTEHLYLHHPFSRFQHVVDHQLVQWADIIHLHWVADFIDYLSFFKSVKKPIVWTLHDKFPAVGVQHYCSDFYPVPDSLKPLDALCRKIKRKGVLDAQNLNLVAISQQMIDVCQMSEVLKGFPINLIHNGVDTDLFRPLNRQAIRNTLEISPDSIVFLFSSYDIHDTNKGLDRLLEALEKVEIPNKVLVCIGKARQSKPKASFRVIYTGLLTDPSKIVEYYSASNFVLQCSYEETFGQTPLEAMSCGIPVISTPHFGSIDLIRPFNGVLCKGFDAYSIASGIKEALSQHYDAIRIRQYVVDNFQYDIIAKQYKALYESIMGRQ